MTWQERNPEKWKQYSKEYRRKNAERLTKYGQDYRRQAKLECIRHYSNDSMWCACCGESEIDFLTIDHINGGGTKERKETGRGGNNFAILLRKRGFPPGYRVLCFNCNCSMAHSKICPHKRVNNVALVQ